MKRDSVTISKAILMTISIVVLLILTTFLKNALVYTFNLDDCINLFLSIILYSISYILLFIIYNINPFSLLKNSFEFKGILIIFVGFIISLFSEIFINSIIPAKIENSINIYSLIEKNTIDVPLHGIYAALYLIVVTVILAPIFEEITYRGIIFDKLKNKITPGIAIIISSILFGFSHLTLGNGIDGFIFGIISGIIYLKFNNLKYNITIHSLMNIITFLILLFK